MRYIMGWRDMYDLTFDERLVYWIRRLFLVLGGAATRHGAPVPISCPPCSFLAGQRSAGMLKEPKVGIDACAQRFCAQAFDVCESGNGTCPQVSPRRMS